MTRVIVSNNMDIKKLPLIKRKKVEFSQLGTLSGSESAVGIRKVDLCVKKKRVGTKLEVFKKAQGIYKSFYSQKAKNFKIPKVLGSSIFKGGEKGFGERRSLNSSDGYLVHTFSIPNGFVSLKHKELGGKSTTEGSFIVNPNLRPERKGLIGYKLYNSLKNLKKPTIPVSLHNKPNSSSTNPYLIP